MSKEKQQPLLYPISPEVFAETIGTFSTLIDDELRLLEAANHTLLPENNPTRFALELHMRPDLKDGDTDIDALKRRAYGTGVLLARRAIKQSIELDDGVEHVVISERQRRKILRKIAKGKPYLSPHEKSEMGLAHTALSDIDPALGCYPYLRRQDELLQAGLRSIWLRDGIPFYGADAMKHDVDDEVPRGMKDLFRIYSLLERDPNKKWQVKTPKSSEDTVSCADAEEDERTANIIEQTVGALTLSEQKTEKYHAQLHKLEEMDQDSRFNDRINKAAALAIIIGIPTEELIEQYIKHETITTKPLETFLYYFVPSALLYAYPHIQTAVLNRLQRRGSR